MAWGTDGNFYGGSNSDRRDVTEAFYKIEEGANYGFPWWIGGAQNPIQFRDYNPNTDRLLPSGANNQGYYNTDPNFPPMPEDVDFIQPYKNIGPDADKWRDPNTGLIQDASDNGRVITSFSAHRSPTGLIFDSEKHCLILLMEMVSWFPIPITISFFRMMDMTSFISPLWMTIPLVQVALHQALFILWT